MFEVEVCYFKSKKASSYSHRKSIEIRGAEAYDMFAAIVAKLKANGTYSIIVVRDLNGWLLASERTNF